MNRIPRLAHELVIRQSGRIAASPFPVTGDMLRYVEEVTRRLRSAILAIEDYQNPRRYQIIDHCQSDVGQIIQNRSVSGPYEIDLVISSFMRDTFRSQVSGGYSYNTSPRFPHNINIEIPLFTGFLNYEDPLLWEDLRKIVIHELIHAFHLEMLRAKGVHLPYRYLEYGGDDETKEKYFLQNQEMTAYEGSWRSEIERRMLDGYSRKDTIRWAVEKLKSQSQKNFGYESFVSKYPSKMKDYITRITKIIDQVYSRDSI